MADRELPSAAAGLGWAGFYALVTATSFVAIRVGVEEFTLAGLVVLRSEVAAVAAACLLLPGRRRGWPVLNSGGWLRAAAMALSGVGYDLLLAQGQRAVSAFGASLLANTAPIWTALLAALLLGETLRRAAWAGVAIAFTGAALIGWAEGGLELSLGGSLSILGAAGLLAVYFVLLRSLTGQLGAERAALLALGLGALAMLPFSAATLADLRAVSGRSLAAVVYLGAVPGALGAWAQARALRVLPAARFSAVLYLVPPLAGGIGWLVLAEVPAATAVLGGALALGGVALVSLPKRFTPAAAQPPSALPRGAQRAGSGPA